MNDHTKYARIYGYKCKRGKSKEYAKLSEELYFADARIKYLALDDPQCEYDNAVTERNDILVELDKISTKFSIDYV